MWEALALSLRQSRELCKTDFINYQLSSCLTCLTGPGRGCPALCWRLPANIHSAAQHSHGRLEGASARLGGEPQRPHGKRGGGREGAAEECLLQVSCCSSVSASIYALRRKARCDWIPVDVAINLSLVVGWKTATEPRSSSY